ncbi:MAG: leucine-rich repeat protein [Clostridia bacterium]|nr:leucine-rich repeat protein [Clostridia bacterium]
MGTYAFNQCKKLKSVSIPKSVTLIDTGAFSRCQSLAEINYSGTQNDWAKIQIKNANQSLTNATLIAEKSDEVIITLDGKPIVGNIDQPPIIENGRTLVPLRVIFEALGAEVTWEDETQTVGATKGDTVISLQIGSAEMKINDTVKTLDVPAKLVNSRTLVPVRAVAEAFGCKVGWDGVTNTVIIETKK